MYHLTKNEDVWMNLNQLRAAAILSMAVAVVPTVAQASQPAMWHYADDNDFRRGTLEGLALHPTLGLTVAARLQRTDVDAEFVHCWLRDGDRLWLGTGLQGKVFAVDGDKAKLIAKVDAPLVASLALDGSGGVYAGLVGKGDIVQVGADGKVTPFVRLVDPADAEKAKAAAAAAQDADADADAEAEPPKKKAKPKKDEDPPRHVWALLKKGSTLYAATGPGGKVFAVDIASKAVKVWAETGADHVLALLDDGTGLLAGTADAALLVRIDGEKQVRALASFPGAEVRALVRGSKAVYAVVNGGQTAAPLASLKATPDRPGTGPTPKTPAQQKAQKDQALKGKGAIWKRTDDGLVMRMYASPEGMLSDAGVVGKQVLAGAARGGRVVIGDDFGDVQSLFDLKEEEVLGVEVGPSGARTLFTGKAAAVYAVGQGDTTALFTTEVLSETGLALWGRVEVVGEGGLEVETRSGFSDVANDSWSPWQALKGDVVQSPPANALQVRVKLTQPLSRLTELKVFRQIANRPPMITKIDTVPNRQKGTWSVSWASEDPDVDTLAYIVQYRPKGTKQWLLLHERFYDKKSMDISPTDMPDGWYEMRVEVTDQPTNGPRQAKATARMSKPFLIDRTRPDVSAVVAGRTLAGSAIDALSRITKVEVSLDGLPAELATPKDGIWDQLTEAWELDLPLSSLAGPHTLLVQVTDDAGNTAALRVPVNP
ncbi:MAG: hypothetical protein EXR79_05675 [Myxococcales bacterium]|nr:hypothetical protein [Myxococcales bacterium]